MGGPNDRYEERAERRAERLRQETYTAGPWAVEPIFGERDLSIVLDYEVPGEGNPIMIGHACDCVDDHIPRSYEEAEANARLMAAAPNLLKELQHLVRLLEPLEKDGGLNVPGLATLNGARAAISEALGN